LGALPSLVGAAPPAQIGSAEIYVVQVEDQLSRLAEKYYGRADHYPLIVEATNTRAAEDKAFSPIDDPNQVEVGQKLWIPGLGDSASTPSRSVQELEGRQTERGLYLFEFEAETGDTVEIETAARPELVMILDPEQYRQLQAGERVTFPQPVEQTESLTRLKVPLAGRWYVAIPDQSGDLVRGARLISGPGVNLYEADELSSGLPEAGTEELIQRLVAATNQARQAHGCPPVTLNEPLNRAAQSHSMNMALDDFFGHVGPDESTAADRVSAAGYRWQDVAENLTAGYSTPEEAVEAWLSSEGHRRNLLNCDLTEMGAGLYYLKSDTGRIRDMNYYWTQVLARPQD
jgi:uncharacterized protein YkwD